MSPIDVTGERLADDAIYLNEDRYEKPKELFKFLADNKDKLIATKRAQVVTKDMPVIITPTIVFDSKLMAKKAAGEPIESANLSSLKVVCIINTTNFLDSHMDLHLISFY